MIDINYNYHRLAELIGYFEDNDTSYSELYELRDKLTDLKNMVEDEMEKF